MNLANTQINFHRPSVIGQSLQDGIKALADVHHEGNLGKATGHCVNQIDGLTESKLTRMRGRNTPKFTRDGQSFVTLIWVLLVEGLMEHRPHDAVQEWLLTILNATDLFEDTLSHEDVSKIGVLFAENIRYQDHVTNPSAQEVSRTLSQVLATQVLSTGQVIRSVPNLNRLFVGREHDVQTIRNRLGIGEDSDYHALTIVRGWPGVGKTALINAIANDDTVRQHFNQDVLWTSLGPNGDIDETLRHWARELRAHHLVNETDIETVRHGLQMILSERNMLIIVDDIWTEAQGNIIKSIVDLRANTVLFTTRFTDIATRIRDMPSDVYVLEVLSDDHAVELLSILAPEPVRLSKQRMPQLVKTLEGLPLALRVAGPLLQYFHETNSNIDALIDEFEQDYNRLLDSKAPSDRFNEETGQTPTIALLFRRSVETLDADAQHAFAILGVFREKPATFDKRAVTVMWRQFHDVDAMIRTIVGRGLLDTTSDQRFRMHQTLNMYAKKLLATYGDDELDDF